eukprot:TRINITY_DN77277_c0_g1_i1.p1 TRINITY_DN77277_c0_g1~~TRINITY_DN77277_c0_g1_i1.p1  ORF type:complete len:257 (-),score=31.53 TRINITY_DN77277_c0_g1_i1:117-827(-)
MDIPADSACDAGTAVSEHKVAIYTLTGECLDEVQIKPGETIRDLKERMQIRQGRSLNNVSLLTDSGMLHDDQSVSEAGLLSLDHVQAVFGPTRYVSSNEDCDAGLYLLPDGSAKLFMVHRRTINCRDDEEHTMVMSSGLCQISHHRDDADLISVTLADFDKSVFNDRSMYGWTSEMGRKDLSWHPTATFLRQGDSVHIHGKFRLPGTLEPFPAELGNFSGHHFFDDWHAEGAFTEP